MESIITFIESIPFWHRMLILGEIILFILVMILWRSHIITSFWKRLEQILDDPRLTEPLITSRYSPASLLRKSKLIERFVQKNDARIIQLIGMDDIWVERLKKTKSRRDFQRVLTYACEKGLFTCFLIGLERRGLASLLVKCLETSGDTFQVRRIGHSCRGEDFNGKKAHKKLRTKMDETRELTGDPEWSARYFAVKLLLHDDDERSLRALWEALEDTNARVRETMAKEFQTDEEDRFYDALIHMVMDDPVYEVRKAAWQRIHKDFSGRYSINPAKLSEAQVFHILELARPGNKDDEDFVLRFLDSANLELRHAAARYLDKNGVLKELCMYVDLGDRQAMERNFKLLEKAVEVNATSFLELAEESNNPATLMGCAQILLENGNRSLITGLTKRSFDLDQTDPHSQELYRMTVECISKRGNEKALKLLADEMRARKAQKEFMALLLPFIPERADFMFVDLLLSFLKDAGFEPKETLREVLLRMPESRVLPAVLDIIQSEKGVPIPVKAEALKLLAGMHKPYCLQTILERLHLVPVEESKVLAGLLADYPKDLLVKKVNDLLGRGDALVRAAILSVLPATGQQTFLKPVRESLGDADPDVRIASVWALVAFHDGKSLDQAVSMLRDPVERVREQAALALGSHGSKPILKGLKKVLFDENEITAVRVAAVRGLGIADSPDAVDILADRLESEEELTKLLIDTLSEMSEIKQVRCMIEHFKDGVPLLRERITTIFIRMGEPGELSLAELLKEDIATLNPYIAEILEATGYVEAQIRRLSHKDPAVRRDTAAFLSRVGTTSAFRGIVMAARDPDEEVRVQVTKALERLETKAGKDILKALEEDPDRRIRKYTHWAMERLKAKEL